MAVVLNELFFPKTDPHTAALLSAFAFCSTYVLRPVGALIFGYIGDTIGRKPTVIITTMLMSISCIIMANLPTYAEVGIIAAWLVTICRIAQGLSSMGEIMGAEIYVTEITKPPVQYPAVAFIGVSSYLGAVVALAIASLVTHFAFNWRIAFWIGACIAVVGSIARTRLRETPEFIKEMHHKKVRLSRDEYIQDKTARKTFWAYFNISCGWPLSFYLAYMYFNPMLQHKFQYTSGEIILHNFVLSFVALISLAALSIISFKVHPLKILKIRGQFFILLIALTPFVITHATHHYYIFLLQASVLIATLATCPANPIFIKHIPTLKRFTTVTFIYALSRAVMYVVTSFSLVYLTDFFGYYGLWLIMFPITFSFLWGIKHFEKLEEESGTLTMKNDPSPASFLAA
jgi:MFS family permease